MVSNQHGADSLLQRVSRLGLPAILAAFLPHVWTCYLGTRLWIPRDRKVVAECVIGRMVILSSPAVAARYPLSREGLPIAKSPRPELRIPDCVELSFPLEEIGEEESDH